MSNQNLNFLHFHNEIFHMNKEYSRGSKISEKRGVGGEIVLVYLLVDIYLFGCEGVVLAITKEGF